MRPDAGMREIAGRLATDRLDEASAAAAGDGPGLDIMAQLAVSLGSLNEELRRARRAQIPWKYCHPVPLNPIVAGSALTGSDERWEPREGVAWHITRVSVQSNSAGGATSVLAAQDSVNAAGAYNLQQFPPPGVAGAAGSFLGCWEPKGTFLLPGNRMVFLPTGGSAVINGEAIEIALDWLPTYLM